MKSWTESDICARVLGVEEPCFREGAVDELLRYEAMYRVFRNNMERHSHTHEIRKLPFSRDRRAPALHTNECCPKDLQHIRQYGVSQYVHDFGLVQPA